MSGFGTKQTYRHVSCFVRFRGRSGHPGKPLPALVRRESPIGDIDRFEIPQRGSRLCYFFCSEAGEGTEQ
jgi:hypothetical protein